MARPPQQGILRVDVAAGDHRGDLFRRPQRGGVERRHGRAPLDEEAGGIPLGDGLVSSLLTARSSGVSVTASSEGGSRHPGAPSSPRTSAGEAPKLTGIAAAGRPSVSR